MQPVVVRRLPTLAIASFGPRLFELWSAPACLADLHALHDERLRFARAAASPMLVYSSIPLAMLAWRHPNRDGSARESDELLHGGGVAERALERFPNDAITLRGRAVLHAIAGEHDEAVATLGRAIGDARSDVILAPVLSARSGRRRSCGSARARGVP